MKRIVKYFEENPWLFYLIAIILIFPAFLVNLGLMPLRFDGAFRGLTALEMIYSDNYLAPTINGEFYYNKPPLFNWFIVLIYKLTGVYNEYTIRIPVILSIFLMGVSIFVFLRKRKGTDFAMINAFLFMTGGCLFFGYSSVGLTDVTYSWFLLLSFFSLYHFYHKQKLLAAFLLSWFFAAAAYMVKGLPAVAFQIITIIVFFLVHRDFKKLFSRQHIIGFLGFALPLALYYYFYFGVNPEGWRSLVYRIFDESAQKSTIGAGNLWKLLEHIAQFPLWFWYNLLPYALLIMFCFRKRFYIELKSDRLLLYAFWAFLANLLVYWLSPGTDKNIKYMIMIFPMFYLIIYYFYVSHKHEDPKRRNSLHYIFFGLSLVFALGSLYAPFYEETENISGIGWISAALFVGTGFFAYMLLKIRMHKLWAFIIVIIIARIGFNLIMQPVYVDSLREVEFKKEAIEAGKIIGDEEVYLCTLINQDVSFYISREIDKVLPRYRGEIYTPGTFYIFDQHQMEQITESNRPYRLYDRFACEYEEKKLFLVKFVE